MTTREAIRALYERGSSKRKIARELGIHRDTVSRYLEEMVPVGAEADEVKDSKCTIPTTGSEPGSQSGEQPSEQANGTIQEKTACEERGQRPIPESTDEGVGRRSHCEPFREIIVAKLEAGLDAKRIWQDLGDECEFEHSYESVKRFVAKLKWTEPHRIWRMECGPGEEMQVDYGTITLTIAGKRRRLHVLRCTLSHSRKGYTEAMFRQDAESFIRGIENAFRRFGGVTKFLVLDNLKAGVLKADLYDPELNPKFASFCQHYNTVALPTLPRTPEHKGKVENNVGYVKRSALKARSFDSLNEVNLHLRRWEKSIADKRIHGTTRRQVEQHFHQSEKSALQPLPISLFPAFVEAKRKVHRDGYVEFDRSYYEAPEEYLSREVWVRSDGRLVHLFNTSMTVIAVHAKLEPGQFTRTLGCGGSHKSVEQNLQYWQRRVAALGEEAALWAEGLVLKRKAAGLRVLMGVMHQLVPRYGRETVNRACAQARSRGQYRLAELRTWATEPSTQQSFDFLSEHKLIRQMDVYGALVAFDGRDDVN